MGDWFCLQYGFKYCCPKIWTTTDVIRSLVFHKYTMPSPYPVLYPIVASSITLVKCVCGRWVHPRPRIQMRCGGGAGAAVLWARCQMISTEQRPYSNLWPSYNRPPGVACKHQMSFLFIKRYDVDKKNSPPSPFIICIHAKRWYRIDMYNSL